MGYIPSVEDYLIIVSDHLNDFCSHEVLQRRVIRNSVHYCAWIVQPICSLDEKDRIAACFCYVHHFLEEKAFGFSIIDAICHLEVVSNELVD